MFGNIKFSLLAHSFWQAENAFVYMTNILSRYEFQRFITPKYIELFKQHRNYPAFIEGKRNFYDTYIYEGQALKTVPHGHELSETTFTLNVHTYTSVHYISLVLKLITNWLDRNLAPTQ